MKLSVNIQICGKSHICENLLIWGAICGYCCGQNIWYIDNLVKIPNPYQCSHPSPKTALSWWMLRSKMNPWHCAKRITLLTLKLYQWITRSKTLPLVPWLLASLEHQHIHVIIWERGPMLYIDFNYFVVLRDDRKYKFIFIFKKIFSTTRINDTPYWLCNMICSSHDSNQTEGTTFDQWCDKNLSSPIEKIYIVSWYQNYW